MIAVLIGVGFLWIICLAGVIWLARQADRPDENG